MSGSQTSGARETLSIFIFFFWNFLSSSYLALFLPCARIGTSYLALKPFVSLGLLDNNLPTISVLCLLPPSCHF
jgi:hypothetical protein